MKKYYIIFAVLTVIFIAAVVYGFSIIGSLHKRQLEKFDQTRINDIQNLHYNIESYYFSNNQLPQSLDDVIGMKYADPETGRPYDYVIVSESSYQLCTNFAADSSDSATPDQYYYGDQQKHKKGYDCLTFNIPAYQIKPLPIPSQ